MAFRDLEDGIRRLELRAGGLAEKVAQLELPDAGTAVMRDARYGTPATVAERVALANLRPYWYNTERQWIESYYAPAGSAGLSVRGLVANVPAGWYPIGDGPQGRLQAIGAQSHTSGSLFTNWQPFGSGNANGVSHRTHDLIERQAGDPATIRTLLPGRYDMAAYMYFQNGSGTGVWEFAYIDGAATANTILAQEPVTLMASFGQVKRLQFEGVYLYDRGRCYVRTAAASWALANAGSYMTLRYVGPALVTA